MVYNVLKLVGYSVFKRTVKLGLTLKQMKERLIWYLQYEYVIAGEPEGSRRDCNTMEKQHSRRE